MSAGRALPEAGATRTPLRARARASGSRRARSVLPTTAAPLLVTWLAQAGGLYAGVLRDQAYWSVPRGDPGGLVYVALGDSVAQESIPPISATSPGTRRPWDSEGQVLAAATVPSSTYRHRY